MASDRSSGYAPKSQKSTVTNGNRLGRGLVDRARVPRTTHAPQALRDPGLVATVVRLAERLRSAGHTDDAIERMVAAWVIEHGGGRPTIEAFLKQNAVLSFTRGTLDRLDKMSRRRVDEATDVAPPLASAPLGRPRDLDYFASLQWRHADVVMASGKVLAEARAAFAPGPSVISPGAVREQHHLASFSGGLASFVWTSLEVPAAAIPGVYALQRDAAATTARASLDAAAVLRRLGPGRALPEALRARVAALMPPGLEVDLGAVRVHDDAVAAELCAEVSAHAFALGAHVVFATGRYAPETSEGFERLLHELVHVGQQARGRVPGGVAGKAAVIDNPSLEREAREVAGDAARSVSIAARSDAAPGVADVGNEPPREHAPQPPSSAIRCRGDRPASVAARAGRMARAVGPHRRGRPRLRAPSLAPP